TAPDRLFRATLVVIEHVHVETALHPHQGGKQADGTRAGDEQYLWLPRARPVSDAFDVVPGLRENAGGLQQYAENPQFGIDSDREFRLDAEAFGAVAVPLLDAAFGVAPVAAHVPLADGACNARLRLRPAHDPDNEVAGHESAPVRCRLDDAERFMAENKALLTGRSKAIAAVENFAIGPAHPERQGAH